MLPKVFAFPILVIVCPFEAWGSRLRSRSGSKGIFEVYSRVLAEKECTCQCCIAELRRPNEVGAQTNAKCTVPPAADSRMEAFGCTKTCSIVNDPIFPSVNVVDYTRYCFYHCVPTATTPAIARVGPNAERAAVRTGGELYDSDCVTIKGESLKQAISADGNGRDAEASTGAER
eukprot:TRINITY_DN2528_c0_g1_i1.p1 TRINITY_DN2528_c0_g1~~TRINITY_DN2528_c0_g1_i1.p1  ORF type:complete len:174 (+),score=18.48 TRINITY_DN2528_c0_g1_i1:133-654(+)